MEQTNALLTQIIQKQQQHTKKTEETQSSWSKLVNTIRSAAVVTGGVALVKNIMAERTSSPL